MTFKTYQSRYLSYEHFRRLKRYLY